MTCPCGKPATVLVPYDPPMCGKCALEEVRK